MPIDLRSVRAVLLFAAAGCAVVPIPPHRLAPTRPAVVPAKAPALTPSASTNVIPEAPLSGDAEEALRARLANASPETGLRLYARNRQGGCVTSEFRAIRAAGTAFDYDGEREEALTQGSFEPLHFPVPSMSLHGLSKSSLLINDTEWFFSEADCQKLPAGAGLADFAQQFWSYDAPLFVPLRDSAGVTCKDLRPRAGETLSLSVFGEEQEYRIERHVNGMALERHVGATRLFARMTVHARDAASFWLNGSPWYYRREACETNKERVKPANFRTTNMVSLTDGLGEPPLRIANEYFTLADEPNGAACRKVWFLPLSAGGRFRTETATGIVQRDYDFYRDEWAFWFGPPLSADLQPELRYRGRFVVPKRMPGGILMDGVPWYETLARCNAARARRGNANKPAPASAARAADAQ